jgi:hypothetical protein
MLSKNYTTVHFTTPHLSQREQTCLDEPGAPPITSVIPAKAGIQPGLQVLPFPDSAPRLLSTSMLFAISRFHSWILAFAGMTPVGSALVRRAWELCGCCSQILRLRSG